MKSFRTKTAPLALKSAPTDGSGSFTAVVSTFGPPPDAQGDVIAVGAFDRSIAEWRRRRNWPVVWWMHHYDDPQNAVGKVTSMQATNREVIVRARLDLASDRAQKVYEGMLTDRLREFSIGYGVHAEHYDFGMKANVIDELEVIEISIVHSGANRHTQLLEIKSAPTRARCRAGHPLPAAKVLAPGTHPAARCATCGRICVWAPPSVSDDGVRAEIAKIRAAFMGSTRRVDPDIARINRVLASLETSHRSVGRFAMDERSSSSLASLNNQLYAIEASLGRRSQSARSDQEEADLRLRLEAPRVAGCDWILR
jgi:hypothetical protein